MRYKKVILLAVCLLAVLPAVLLLPPQAVPVIAENPKTELSVFVPVIMYHAVIDNPNRIGDFIITPQTFENDMEYLKNNGYTTVFPSEIIDFAEFGKPLPPNPVLITFDDGHYGLLRCILPILEERSLKANVNIEGAYTEQSTIEDDHNPAYSYLTWEEIRLLHDSGRFEIGNHTYDMHSLTGLRKGCRKNPGESLAAYERALADDVGKLQSILAGTTGVMPRTFAYPFGYVSDESIPVLRSIGLKLLMTCYEKPNYVSVKDELPLILHRYNRPGNMSTEKFMAKVLARDN